MANHVIRDRIWDSKKLAGLSLEAALAYPWIYLVADDYGRFEYSPRRIWSKVFGSRDDVSIAEVTTWLSEYERVGLLTRYHIDGDLAFWTGFKQRPPSKCRPSDYPDPQQFSQAAKKQRRRSKTAAEAQQDGSAVAAYNRTEHNRTGTEGAAAAPQPEGEVFDHWKAVMGHPDAKLTDKRQKAIKARLKDGYTVEQLKRAVNGCKASAFHMGDNQRKEVYDDLELICRSGEKVEQFMAKVKPQPTVDGREFIEGLETVESILRRKEQRAREERERGSN